MRVNMNKTKVMISGEHQKPVQKTARWPCGVCGRGVGNNSIQCTGCHKWVHKKCSGGRRSLLKCSSQRLDWYNKIKHTKHSIM